MTALCRIEEECPACAYSVHTGLDKLTRSLESQAGRTFNTDIVLHM